MKINSLELENVKRIKAVKLKPTENGLTVIGGENCQGKSSVLDAIAWALGGENYRPTEARRVGSATEPYLRIVMDNGLVVERKGKNSDLKITDPSGQKAGQKLLDSFISKLALDLPKFMEANDSEKANILLNIIGVGDRLKELETAEKNIYSERTAMGRIADQKKKFADEQPYFPEAPDELVSASDLIKEQQEILARNGQRQMWIREHNQILEQVMKQEDLIEDLTRRIAEAKTILQELREKEIQSQKTPNQLKMESTQELEESIRRIDEINRKVRANLDKNKALDDAKAYADQYEVLTTHLDEVRKSKKALLDGASLPLPGLGVSDGKLTFNGIPWDGISGAEKLKISTAIVRELNPKCQFVLVDKLEQMDMRSLKEFGEWAEAEGLQIIGTRVSTGEECSILITDGYGDNMPKEQPVPAAWKEGTF